MNACRAIAGVAIAATLCASTAPLCAQEPGSDSHQVCAQNYEAAQEHRVAGALQTAQAELARCAQDQCPAFIRSDCQRWSTQVEAELPTLIFAAKRQGQDLKEVRVSNGEQLLGEHLQGQAVPLDPGSYDLRFETPDSPAIVRHLVVERGQTKRLIEVEFAPPTTSRFEPVVHGSHASALPWLLLGVGAAGVSAGAGLSLWGQANEAKLMRTCSPTCSDAELRPVRIKYALGDVSLGLGLASLVTASYLFLSERSSTGAARLSLPLSVYANASGVTATYGGKF